LSGRFGATLPLEPDGQVFRSKLGCKSAVMFCRNSAVEYVFFDKRPMTNLIAGTDFERQLRRSSHGFTDAGFRRLVFTYCQLYQEIYWFDQLENAFAYLELADCHSDAGQTELASVRSEVEEAMGEYFESLNEVAEAIHRLLDDTPFTVDDTISCIAHVWNAYSCNEDLSEFRSREDRILCDLLAKTTTGQ
jgi:hypothetical protein